MKKEVDATVSFTDIRDKYTQETRKHLQKCVQMHIKRVAYGGWGMGVRNGGERKLTSETGQDGRGSLRCSIFQRPGSEGMCPFVVKVGGRFTCGPDRWGLCEVGHTSVC